MTAQTQAARSRPDADPRDMPHRYSAELACEIESRWQAHWDEQDSFKTLNPGEVDFDASKPKFYCLDMFPYPSGAGLHVGHPEGYTATDIVCRYHRHKGYNVLHPMGWDAFGLPAEQYAIQTGVHPAKTTRAAIETFRGQLKRFGFSYDWSREFATIDPDYYRWTQQIWLLAYNAWFDPRINQAKPIRELFDAYESGDIKPVIEGVERNWSMLSKHDRRIAVDEKRLAYLSEQVVNWCPKLGTALANEEVIDGKSERGGFPVFRKPLKQWMFRITAFADRLLSDLEKVEWPESTRTMQEQWIGRSEGAEVDFPIIDSPAPDIDALRVYTTRPDTIFGATFMVIAPEHPLVDSILAKTNDATLRGYVDQAKARADVDRMADAKTKTGVPTGFAATNPATGQAIPVWVADYVLMGYGHGAIMAVPGQDQRDWDFAKTFDLPIVRTIQPPEGFPDEPFMGEGPAINSDFLDGLNIPRRQVADHRLVGRKRPGHARGELQTARLAVQPPAVLGRALPDRLRRTRQPLSG